MFFSKVIDLINEKLTFDHKIRKVMQLNLSSDLYTSTVCHFVGTLSPKSKRLLTLPENERTGVGLTDLLSEMESIEFFKIFSNQTKGLLAKKLMFVTHGADEVLLTQGEINNPPQAMYILMSGVVTEIYRPFSEKLKSLVCWPEKILRKGDFFGHVDIIHGRPPSVHAHTVGYSELLKLKKEDFGLVANVMETHCSKISYYLQATRAIRRFEWPDEEHKVLEVFSKLYTYPENHYIYSGDGSKRPFWSYFVVSGACKLLRELLYTVTESGNRKPVGYVIGKESETENTIRERIEFEEVHHGFFFGVGEDFSRNHVVASTSMECLLIPRLLLLFKNKGLLQKMAKDLTNSFPSDQKVLDCYSKLKTASKEKVKMFKDMFKDKPGMLADGSNA